MNTETQSPHPVGSSAWLGVRRIKVSDDSRSDFDFFVQTDLDMIGAMVGVKDPRDDANGCAALECWYQRDTHGEVLPCREIELLQKAERGKASWNLQIKMWAEDVADGMLLRQSELVEYCHGLPAWIFEAVMAQAHLTALRKQVGDPKAQFVKGYEKMKLGPRFARAEYLWRNLWLPEMDCFDAVI